MNLGETIYRLRTEKNMSQGDFAEAMEVSRQSVSKWENNVAIPDLEKLVKMAALFEISLDELVAGKAKDTLVTSPPQESSAPAHQAKQGLTTQQIIGIVLLGFGSLCFVVFTIVGIYTGSIFSGMILALPLLFSGLICLLCKRNIGLKCAWAVYMPLWLLFTVFLTR